MSASGAHLGRARRWARPRDARYLTALLIGGDQQRRIAAGARRALKLRDQRAGLGPRGDVLAVEDHATDLTAPDATEQTRVGRGPVHSDHDLLTDHLRKRWGW